jgi:AraC-like DNA-binding protein
MVLARWSASALVSQREIVSIYPDGCRDVILSALPGHAPTWFLSPLDTQHRRVTLAAGHVLHGFRLAPGVQLPPELLWQLRHDDVDAANTMLTQACHVEPRVAEVLTALSTGEKTTRAIRKLAISKRSVQRLLENETGQGPLFWARLARVRLAAQSIVHGQPLAECAIDSGFSDQAHMTREFRHWFALTPALLRKSPAAASAILASGYAV